MSRVKSLEQSETVVAAKPESVPEFRDDGHPNPDFYPKDGEGFEAFQAALDQKALWGDYFGKLYRVKPLRHTDDKPPRLEKFASSMTLDYVRKKYGGRKFSAWLSRRVGIKDWIVGKFQFDIEAPAIWQDGEGSEETGSVGGTPATATEQANTAVMGLFERLLTDVLKQRDQASTEGKGFNTGDAFKAALETQKDSSKQAIEFVREQSKGEGKGDSAIVTVLGNMLTEMMKSNNSKKEDPILQMLLERALEKPADPFATITGMLTLLKDLGVKIGSGRGAAGSFLMVAAVGPPKAAARSGPAWSRSWWRKPRNCSPMPHAWFRSVLRGLS